MPQVRKFKCLRCGKLVKENISFNGFRGIKTDNQQVSVEAVDYCNKCGKKQINFEKLSIRIAGAIGSNLITEEFYLQWKNKEISQKEFIETLQKREKEVAHTV